jgi:hypothetical protein
MIEFQILGDKIRLRAAAELATDAVQLAHYVSHECTPEECREHHG